jgi:hypothetical protein
MALKIGTEDKKKVAIAGVLGVIVLGMVGYQLFQTFAPSPTPAAPPVAMAPGSVNPGSVNPGSVTPGSVNPGSATPGATSGPVSGPAQQRTSVAGSRAHEAEKVGSSMARLDPTLHPEWMAEAESLEYSGKGRNIFSMFSTPAAIEEAKAPIRPVETGPPVPTGPPPPPPIDLKFFGFEASTAGTRKVFLLHGDDVFIAAEGDVVDHRYKVVKIAPFSAQVEDIPYHNTQTLPLIQN